MLVVDAPFNSLSFGQVSFNILREFWRRGVETVVFPIEGKVDIGAFGALDPDFQKWLESSLSQFGKFSRDDWTFKLWHLNGSHKRTTARQALLSFYECNQPTQIETAIASLQDSMMFGSQYASDSFPLPNVSTCHIGFDEDIKPTGKKYLEGKIHFGLMGKFEKRKHTAAIIKTWLAKYGNDPRCVLTCCVTNPFLPADSMQKIIQSLLGQTRWRNVNFLPYLGTNAEVVDFLNAIDVDLTGLSGGEGWNLPAFNATGLGKWSVVLNATAHKDWATDENAILVEPDSQMPVDDGVFFRSGEPFNQGSFYTFHPDQAIEAMEKAFAKVEGGIRNVKGLELQKQFSYSRTADQILKVVST